jgi:hypothetical protein
VPRRAGEACIRLARLGTGYAGNSMILLGGLAQWDQARDLGRSLFLKKGPIVIDRGVQFIGDSRYLVFDQALTTPLFHPFLKPLRAQGGFNEIFDGIGLTAYWQTNPGPD